MYNSSSELASEEDLVNDCCVYMYSSGAKKRGLQGFILNSNNTACIMFGEEGKGENGENILNKSDIDTAKNVFKPAHRR